MDPTYLELSESTGGQIFLLQKGEVAQSAVIMGARDTHPATVIRAVGQLSGEKTFEFPIDSTVESLLMMVSVQCRQSVALMEPAGVEITPNRANHNIDLQAGRIVRMDQPSPGPWRLKITGQGLYVFSVLVKSPIQISVADDTDRYKVDVAGMEAQATTFEVNAAGERSEGNPRFRLSVTGTDSNGYPVMRTHPVLFRANPAKRTTARLLRDY